MKKYPSYTTVNSFFNDKKALNVNRYQKPTTPSHNSPRQTPIRNMMNIGINKKQSVLKLNSKKANDQMAVKKQNLVEKKRTENNENAPPPVAQKHQYQALKNRLHALEDRLIEIKKSYQLRKTKGQHFSIQKLPQKVQAQNDKQLLINNLQGKKKLTVQVKSPSDYQTITQRLAVQSPKAEPLQQINKNQMIQVSKQADKKLKNEKQKQQVTNNAQYKTIHQFVTQYEQKPIPFKHTTSEVNLLKPSTKNIGKKQNKNTQIYYISSLLRALQSPKPSTFDQLCTSHLLTSHEFLSYVKNAGVQKPAKPVIKALNPPTKKHTIIFDLDQTLIHCLDTKKGSTSDISLPILFPDRNKITVGINIRPYTKQCLKQLNKYFEIMVFTASHANYANAIVDYLDPTKQLISYRFSRQHCHKTQQGFYVKDLRVIDRKLSNVLLIDNAAYSYCFQPENGIPIVPFYDNKADLELKNLIPYLKSFINESDVRIKNNQIMKISQYSKFKNAQDLINSLYK